MRVVIFESFMAFIGTVKQVSTFFIFNTTRNGDLGIRFASVLIQKSDYSDSNRFETDSFVCAIPFLERGAVTVPISFVTLFFLPSFFKVPTMERIPSAFLRT
jgi:hypothetical protein